MAKSKRDRRGFRMWARAYAQRIRPLILIRDGWKCRLCGQPIDPGLKGPDPMSGTVDHIVSLGDGGTSDEWNLQAAHLACNERKNDEAQGRVA